MCEKSRKVCDFSKFRLRSLELQDGDRILEWRNASVIRTSMINDKIIDPVEHATWLKRTLVDAARTYFVFEVEAEAAGVIGFYAMDDERLHAEWSFYLRPTGVPRGAGTVMGFLALEWLFLEAKVFALKSEVISANQRSLRMHRRLGFSENGVQRRVRRNGMWLDLIELSLNAEDWSRIRDEKCADIVKYIGG